MLLHQLAPVVMAMYAQAIYYGNPADPGTWLQEPYASEAAQVIDDECLVGIAVWLGGVPEQVFQPEVLAAVTEGRWDDLEPFTSYMDMNTPDGRASDVPVLVLHGEDDLFVPVDLSRRLAARLCVHGTPVKLSRYEGVGHIGIPAAAQLEAIQWVEDRLAGMPAPDSCADVLFRAFLPTISH